MASEGQLGDYLRARRALVQPADVGIALTGGVRRVAGLRREEVAILAGISSEYYLRLERGRDAHPSVQVVNSLARALQLDDVAAGYLHELAHPAALEVARPDADQILQRVGWLIDSWPVTAAVVHNRYMDVLASNPVARALSPAFEVGANNVASLLVDPAEKALHRSWESLTARSVALLRTMVGQRTGDARLDELVADLTRRSALFRELWGRNDVVQVSSGTHLLDHPLVGELVLGYSRFPIVGSDGQTIFMYYAEPGTATATALENLARGAAGNEKRATAEG